MRERTKKTTPAVAAPMGRWRALVARCLDMAARGEVLPATWQNALFTLFIGGILAYGAGFAWYMLARFDLINLLRDVNADDSFYYFEIARNLAEGKFSTFDGGITRTNGYHPLWLFLITPFYWIFDKEAALFAIKAFEIMLVAGGVALVTAAARLARMPWYLMFAALPTLYQQYGLFLGMEAAAALFMLGLFILTVCLFARSPTRWKWPLAAVAFALPWVRLEYIAISLAATGALCLIEWLRQERAHSAPLGERVRSVLSVKVIVPFLAAGAGILVFFAYNKLVFGGIVPVSGATKAAWSQVLWKREGGYSFAQNFRDVLQIPAFDYELLVALEICAYLLLVWWFARRSRSRKDWLLLAFLAGVFGLAAGHLAKFGQTVLTVYHYLGDYPWYFVPAYLMMALIIPVRCYVAIYFIRRFIGPKSHRAANILSLGIVVVGAVFLAAKADFTSPFRFVDWTSEATSREWEVTSYMGTQVMDRLLPEDSVVGSWDAGVIGYFSRFPVVNLDGLVNSYDYLRAGKEGTGATFYQRYGITHFANLAPISKPHPPHPPSDDTMLFESLSYLNYRSEHRFKLWSTEPPPETLPSGFDRSANAKFWERMGPHFDFQSDGAGFLVDGRLVQTFARECDPDELVVWSWVGSGDETAFDSWAQTQTGLCVAVLILPHSALPPVRVEIMTVDDYVARLVGDSLPIIRSDWDVYLVGNSLIYKKEQCTPEDTEPIFFLHVDPVDMNNLPNHRKQYGFDNHDFDFGRHGWKEADTCLATVPLPEYGIATIGTGQYVQANSGVNILWNGEIRLDEMPVEAKLFGENPPVIRSDWDIYLIGNSLIYKKEQCTPEDTEPIFFLHVDPVDMNNLPNHRKQYGFDNHDFDFGRHGWKGADTCLAVVPLPEYGIATIGTGQFVQANGGFDTLWKGEIRLDE